MKIEYHCIQGHWKAVAIIQHEPTDESFIRLVGQGASKDQAKANLLNKLLSTLDDLTSLFKKL